MLPTNLFSAHPFLAHTQPTLSGHLVGAICSLLVGTGRLRSWSWSCARAGNGQKHGRVRVGVEVPSGAQCSSQKELLDLWRLSGLQNGARQYL